MNKIEIRLTATAYLQAHASYRTGVTGGTIHDFLRESVVEYHGGKCPVYYVVHRYNSKRVIIGGNYASNGKPKLVPFGQLDFI